MAMIICPKCGGQISDRAPRCPHCGYVRSNDNQPQQPTPTPPAAPAPPAPQQQPTPTPQLTPTQRPTATSGGKLNTTHIVIIAAALIVGIAICVAAILLTRDDEKQAEIIETAPIESSYSTTDDGEEQHIEADEFQPDQAAEEDFIWLSDSRIDISDIAIHGYSTDDARVLRNAIFARHGYRFKSQDLRDYFNQFSWYMPRFDDVTSHLSEVERENIQFLKSLE
ncbi:MAG: YARHG domain-containing protein [Candidatus Limisoma sp.]